MKTTEIAVTLETLNLRVELEAPKLTTKDDWQCHEWWLHVWSTNGKQYESFQYYTGTGISTAKTPDPIEVLACISRDYIGANDASFEDWCSEFGCDTDSIKAEGIYNACRETGARLLNLILFKDIEALANLEF